MRLCVIMFTNCVLVTFMAWDMISHTNRRSIRNLSIRLLLARMILTILTVLGSILLLIGYIGKKQKEREDENGNVILNAEGEAETDDIKKKGGWRLASIIPAVAAVIAFILTENMRLPMVLVDKWTLLMVIIALVQLLVAYFSKKKTQEPEQPEQMVANA